MVIKQIFPHSLPITALTANTGLFIVLPYWLYYSLADWLTNATLSMTRHLYYVTVRQSCLETVSRYTNNLGVPYIIGLFNQWIRAVQDIIQGYDEQVGIVWISTGSYIGLPIVYHDISRNNKTIVWFITYLQRKFCLFVKLIFSVITFSLILLIKRKVVIRKLGRGI